MESAITWGLTSAMFGEILIEGGETRQKNFHPPRGSGQKREM